MTTTQAESPAPVGGLGLVAATALVMGNMIGSGVFLLPASLAPFGWNAVLAWLVTTGGAMTLALVLARLTRAVAGAGSPAGFVTAAFGESAGFFIAWIYLVSIWTANVTIAVAAISYLSSLWPALHGMAAAAAIVLIWLMTFLNLRGTRAVGGFQVVTLALKIVPLVMVLAIAAVLLLGGEADVTPIDAVPIGPGPVNAAASLTLWALLGFESASVVAAQVRNPQVNIPRATVWGTGLTGLLYLLVCSAIALLLPMAVAAASPAPFTTFVGRFWSPTAGVLVTGFAVISCVGALNGWTLLQGELMRDMAERRLLPAWFAVADANGAARHGLIVSALVGTAFGLMNATRSMQGLFEWMLLLSTSAALWLYLACAASALKLGVGRGLAVVGGLYAIWALWGAGIGASGLSFVLMLMGLPLWLWTRRKNA